MSELYAVMIHRKENWTLTLKVDGTIILTSHYKRRVNINHVIPLYDSIDSMKDYVPGYVFDMLVGAKYEWNEWIKNYV